MPSSSKFKNRKRVNVTFEMETYKVLENIAAEKKISIPELIREYAEQGISGNYQIKNIELITQILRVQMKQIIDPAVERLASLEAKTCIQAATSAYLNAEAISCFVPEHLQEDFKEVYEKARKKAIGYVRNKDK